MALLATLRRLKTALRLKKKKIEIVVEEEPEQPKTDHVPEAVQPSDPQDAVPTEEADIKPVSFMHITTMKANEKTYTNFLVEAVHHPQVLSIKTDLKLEAAPQFYRELRVCRVFIDTTRIREEDLLPFYGPVAPHIENGENCMLSVAESLPTKEIITSNAIPATTAPPSPALSKTMSDTAININHDDHPLPLSQESPVISVRKEPCLNIYDFVEDDYIGSGAWGLVHLARHRKTSHQVAIKSIQKSKVAGSEFQVLREQETLRAVAGQRGVLDLLASFHDGGYFYLATRFCHGGNFEDFLVNMGCPPEPLLRFFAAQLLLCLENVHARGVIHRDLKPANLFLDKNCHLVIGDFGLATFASDEEACKHFCGTIEYVAREIWHGGAFSFASDVWAYGAVLFEMAVGRRLFDSDEFTSVQELQSFMANASLEQWIGEDEMPETLYMLLHAIFESNENTRPTLASLKESPFFADMDWDALAAGELPCPGLILPEGQEDMPTPVEDGCPYSDGLDVWGDEDPFPTFSFTSHILATSSIVDQAYDINFIGDRTVPLLADDGVSPSVSPLLDSPDVECDDTSCDSEILRTPSPETDIAPIIASCSDLYEDIPLDSPMSPIVSLAGLIEKPLLSGVVEPARPLPAEDDDWEHPALPSCDLITHKRLSLFDRLKAKLVARRRSI